MYEISLPLTTTGRIRSLVERCIHRLKIFGVVSLRWRHALSLHGVAFRSIINLVELSFDIKPPILEIDRLLLQDSADSSDSS
jgi:hypothetical protein